MVGKPHGVRGEVRIVAPAGDLAWWKSLSAVSLRRKDGTEFPVELASARSAGETILVSFKGYESRSAVETLRRAAIRVPSEKLPSLPDGVYYHSDILGLSVETEDGVVLGRVEEIIETGANDVYVVRGGGRETLVPAIRQVIVLVEPERGRMVIRPMPGLLSEES